MLSSKSAKTAMAGTSGHQRNASTPAALRERFVNMDVICLGLPRTGTASLRSALQALGFDGTYHFDTLHKEGRNDSRLWIQAIEAKYNSEGVPFTVAEWDNLLFDQRAVIDLPAILFAHDLLSAYPTAKLILTVRTPPSATTSADGPTEGQLWADSFTSTTTPFFASLTEPAQMPLARRTRYRLSGPSDLERLAAHIRTNFLDAIVPDPATFYEQWNLEIVRIAEELGRDLLIFDVKEGWAPLCDFLGCDVPLNADSAGLGIWEATPAETVAGGADGQAGGAVADHRAQMGEQPGRLSDAQISEQARQLAREMAKDKDMGGARTRGHAKKTSMSARIGTFRAGQA